MLLIPINEVDKYYLPLIDFHTHIGKVKIETTKGKSQRVNTPQQIIQLYQKLHYELHKRFRENVDQYICNFPSVEDFSKPFNPLMKSILDTGKEKPRGWLIDQIVTFPFNDIFHQSTSPKFIKSNRFIRSQVYSLENTFRFIPFCRVDPTDAGSSAEVIKSINLGMRGLKLHPLSQGWIENIRSEATQEVLKTAAKLDIPVIFDVPNSGVAKDIIELQSLTDETHGISPNIVLGHTGFDYSSVEIFMCLDQDNIFTEVSGMRGKDVEIFFNNVTSVNKWYNKILFGSDHNYFSVLQAADFISFLFTKKFYSILDNLSLASEHLKIVAKILGFNALNLIPQSWEKNIVDSSFKFKGNYSFSDLYDFLRNFLTQDSCYASLDMVQRTTESKIANLLTLGKEFESISVEIEADYQQKKISISPARNDYLKLTTASLNNSYNELLTTNLKKRKFTKKKSISRLLEAFTNSDPK